MSGEDFRERIAELARRSGLAGPQRAVVAVAIVVCCIAIILAAFRWWPSSGGKGFAIEPAAEAGAAAGDVAAGEALAGEPSASGQAQETTLVVHVAGAVRHPGVVRCASGSRVGDAVSAAGGLLGNAAGDAVNLARTIADGEMIYIPTLDEVAAGAVPPTPVDGGGPGGAASPGVVDGLIDLNTATADQLQTLPGVGPAISARIVSDREANGPFAAPEDLMRVSGIGQKKFAAVKDLVTVR